jgi:transmembrane sensor
LICGLFAWQQLFLAPQRGVLQSDQYAKTHETDKGERRDHQLPDGSRLSLNTNTRVGVQYSPEHRNLYLEQGEIHLRVESDPTRPLTVFAGARIFRAVGTEFNLEISDDQQIELVVTEGIVMIGVLAAAPDGDGFSRPMLLPDTGTFVSAGRELVVSTSSDLQEIVEAPEAIDQEDIAVKLSWRDGNLIFRGESLEEAIAEVGRYTEVEFVFLDETAKRQTVSGLFRAGDVDGLLLTLRNNFNITHELVAGDRVLLRTHAVD